MRQPPDLEIVNRTLGETVRKQEEDIKKLRAALFKSLQALNLAGYYLTAEEVAVVWKETAS